MSKKENVSTTADGKDDRADASKRELARAANAGAEEKEGGALEDEFGYPTGDPYYPPAEGVPMNQSPPETTPPPAALTRRSKED
jgi:hypothetical protein